MLLNGRSVVPVCLSHSVKINPSIVNIACNDILLDALNK